MDYQPLNTEFELPKTPASTLHNDESDDNDDDDVVFMGTIVPPVVDQQTTVDSNWSRQQNPGALASMLATPPLSPQNMGTQQNSMPILTALLAQNTTNHNSGYRLIIPCYLCDRPFSDITQLSEHLTMHATLLMQHFQQGPATDTPNLYPLPPIARNLSATVAESQSHPQPQPLPQQQQQQQQQLQQQQLEQQRQQQQQLQQPQQQVKTTLVSCDECGKFYISRASLRAHKRQQHMSTGNNESCVSKTLYRCDICRKSYRREKFLQKHMICKHGQRRWTYTSKRVSGLEVVAKPETTSAATLPATSAQQRQRPVWSTKLFNAVAAANYSPATETASKYLPPTPAPKATVGTVPKQKYPLRSPYFNPNLWVDDDTYVE